MSSTGFSQTSTSIDGLITGTSHLNISSTGIALPDLTTNQVVISGGNSSVTSLSYSKPSTNNSIVQRDEAANISSNNFILSTTTTNNSSVAINLSKTSPGIQYFTGTSGPIVKLPNGSTLDNGWPFYFFNNGSGTITINNFASTTLETLLPGANMLFTLTSTGNPGTWRDQHFLASTTTSSTSGTFLPGTLTIGNPLAILQGGTGTTTATGTGSLVLSNTPTLVTPDLGTPTSGTLTSCTGLPIVAGTTGTLSVARGGTGVTTSTGSSSVVLSNTPTLVTPVIGAATGTSLLLSSFSAANVYAPSYAAFVSNNSSYAIVTAQTNITGSDGSNMNVFLPTATTARIGSQYIVYNNSSGYINFVTASGATLLYILPNFYVTATCVSNANDTITSWIYTTNSLAIPAIAGYTTRSASLLSVALDRTATQQQWYTGVSVLNSPLKLPTVLTGLSLGQNYDIINNSAAQIVVADYQANFIANVSSGTRLRFTVLSISSDVAASWGTI